MTEHTREIINSLPISEPDALLNKLLFVKKELNRYAALARAAQFSQSTAANAMALELLKNPPVVSALKSQNSIAEQALEQVKEHKFTKQQLIAGLILAERLVRDEEQQKTEKRVALHYAYLAHQKRARPDQAQGVVSQHSAKL